LNKSASSSSTAVCRSNRLAIDTAKTGLEIDKLMPLGQQRHWPNEWSSLVPNPNPSMIGDRSSEMRVPRSDPLITCGKKGVFSFGQRYPENRSSRARLITIGIKQELETLGLRVLLKHESQAQVLTNIKPFIANP